jgi:hypothetical protein
MDARLAADPMGRRIIARSAAPSPPADDSARDALDAAGRTVRRDTPAPPIPNAAVVPSVAIAAIVAARKPKSSRPRLYLSRAKGRRRRAARARARACYAAIAIRARVRRSGEPNDPRRACGERRARSSADGAARRAVGCG